ncbi:MAG: winged helix-turn-helix transcriptional regulator [Candidatus Kariarchaeaceae archaeon]
MIIQYRVNWRYFRGAISIFLLTLSIFTFFGVSSPNFVTHQLGSQTPRLVANLDVTNGIPYQIEIRSLFQEINLPQLLFSSIIQSTQPTSMITNLQSRFEQVSSLTAVTIGPLAYELYKLLRSSPERKEGGNNRDLIKTTITNTPGITLRGITRVANIAMGSTQYWVRILEQEKEIDSHSLGNSKHYFDLKQNWSSDAKLLYSLIQNKRILEILQCLNDNPSITTQKDLCTNLGIHKALLSYYIKILKNHNVIEHQVRDLSISPCFKDFFT